MRGEPRGGGRARHLKPGPSSLYCSEACLSDALIGLPGREARETELENQLRRCLERLRVTGRRAAEDAEDARSEALDAREALRRIADTIGYIRDEELTREINTTERGRSLSRSISAIERDAPRPRRR